MRESPISRLTVPRRVLAGATAIACMLAYGALAQEVRVRHSDNDTAMAVPRVAPHGSAPVGLPEPLAPSDAARVRHIFAEQASGDLEAAAADTARLTDSSLLGPILADHYLAQGQKADPAALVDWLRRYPAQPDSLAIQALLRRVRPDADSPVPAPAILQPVAAQVVPAKDGAGDALTAAQQARQLFEHNRDQDALNLASNAMGMSDPAGQAAYVAGLAAWRLNQADRAMRAFEAASRAPHASSGMRAAGAFWAARAHLRARDAAGFVPWMARAAAEPSSFYGMIARRTLGMGIDANADQRFVWDHDVLAEADVEAVGDTALGQLCFALLQVGQNARAEAALRLLWPKLHDETMRRSLALVARAAGLNTLSAQMADLIGADGTGSAANVAIPALRPAGGFQINPAIIYALARVESGFRSNAVSEDGAQGIMQLMPQTASAMAAGGVVQGPGANLAYGQRYVLHLAGLKLINNDLIRLLASYNSGPGNFARWSASIRDGGDPLMFLEAIPVDETRAFIPHILTYIWLYSARMGISAPSLDEMAGGAWPHFRADTVTSKRAQH